MIPVATGRTVFVDRAIARRCAEAPTGFGKGYLRGRVSDY